jgi:hypothetical protein
MFDANIATQFKVSNTPSLMGWNSTMSINVILDQLQDSYGKPNIMTLFNNDTLFQSPMAPTNLPEMLFYCIKQCQEIQRIGKLPYILMTKSLQMPSKFSFKSYLPPQGI